MHRTAAEPLLLISSRRQEGAKEWAIMVWLNICYGHSPALGLTLLVKYDFLGLHSSLILTAGAFNRSHHNIKPRPSGSKEKAALFDKRL